MTDAQLMSLSDYARLLHWDANMAADETYECVFCSRAGSPRSAVGIVKKKDVCTNLQRSCSFLQTPLNEEKRRRIFSPVSSPRSNRRNSIAESEYPILSAPQNSPTVPITRDRSNSIPIRLNIPCVFDVKKNKFDFIEESENYQLINVYNSCPDCARKIKAFHVEL